MSRLIIALLLAAALWMGAMAPAQAQRGRYYGRPPVRRGYYGPRYYGRPRYYGPRYQAPRYYAPPRYYHAPPYRYYGGRGYYRPRYYRYR